MTIFPHTNDIHQWLFRDEHSINFTLAKGNSPRGKYPTVVGFAAQRAMSYWVHNRVEFDFDGDWRNSQVNYNDFDCKWLEERLGIFVAENEMDLQVRENHLEQIVEAAREDMDAQDEYLFFKWSQADEDSVYDLPLVKIDEELRCLICIEDMKIGETGKELPCEHVFHDGCIEEWLLDYNHVCPICKFEMPVAEIDDD